MSEQSKPKTNKPRLIRALKRHKAARKTLLQKLGDFEWGDFAWSEFDRCEFGGSVFVRGGFDRGGFDESKIYYISTFNIKKFI